MWVGRCTETNPTPIRLGKYNQILFLIILISVNIEIVIMFEQLNSQYTYGQMLLLLNWYTYIYCVVC